MATRHLIVCLLLAAPIPWQVRAQTDATLPLSNPSVGCIDDVSGWYVIRVAKSPHRAGFVRFQVVDTLSGPKKQWLTRAHQHIPIEWPAADYPPVGALGVSRVGPQHERGALLDGGCSGAFWQGQYGTDAHAYPVQPPYYLPRYTGDKASDMFHHRLAYLRAHFALRTDPKASRFVADLRSGSMPLERAAIELLPYGPDATADVGTWDELGRALVRVIAHWPPHFPFEGAFVAALGGVLTHSVNGHRRDPHPHPPWWRDAARVLVSLPAPTPATYSFAASHLRLLGFKLDPHHPTLEQYNSVRRQLGVRPLPTGARLGVPTQHGPAPLRLRRDSVMPTVRYLNRRGLSPAEQARIQAQIRRTGWKPIKRNGAWTIVPLVGPSRVQHNRPPSGRPSAPVSPAAPSSSPVQSHATP